MYIHWDKAYETNQPLIDTEHRLLMLFFRKLDVALKTQESEETIRKIILETSKFVEFHFISEENVMRETDYPGIDRHRKVHRELLSKLEKKTAKLALHHEYPEDLLSFWVDWLIDHIAGEDQRLAEHVGQAARRPVAEIAYGEYLLIAAPK
jgi:hemerythrin-like metal-binding protein